MEDPRQQPIPDQPFLRAIAFAKCLAYGVLVGDWSPNIVVTKTGPGAYVWEALDDQGQKAAFRQHMGAWSKKTPSTSLLTVLGYIEPIMSQGPVISLILTKQALGLLAEPIVLPTAFIAYKRSNSSAFALLLEARLREVGVKAFIDRLIEGGDEWEALIKTTIIEKVSHFICTIGSTTLLSQHVCNEIHWALDSNKIVIPIWHGDFEAAPNQLPDDRVIKEFVHRKNAIRVIEESAQAYDDAINRLLNQLQFATSTDIDPLTLQILRS